MELRNVIDSMSRSLISSIIPNMEPKEKGSSSDRWSSSQGLLGSLINSGNSLAQTKNRLRPSTPKYHNTPLMRLDSQGEVISTPEYCPPETEMSRAQQHMRCAPKWGWPDVAWNQPRPLFPNNMQFIQPQPYGYYPPSIQHQQYAYCQPHVPNSYAGGCRFNGHSGQYWNQQQVPPYDHFYHHSVSYVTPQNMNFTNRMGSPQVYHFQGHNIRNFREPYRDGPKMSSSRNSQTSHHMPKQFNRRKIRKESANSGASQSGLEEVSRVIDASEVAEKMANMKISSDNLLSHGCGHGESHGPLVGNLPENPASLNNIHEVKTPDINVSNGPSCLHDAKKNDVKSCSHDETLSKHDCLGHGGINDDLLLAIELCGSADANCESETKIPDSVPPVIPSQNSGQSSSLTATILTPKTTCITGSRKKKGRPSAKKRQRKKQQTNPDAHVLQVTRQSKKRRTDVPQPDGKTGKRCDMSFVIDFSESSESDSIQFGASPNTVGSPPVRKFSFVINAADFDDDSTESDTESSDSDFFEENGGQQWDSMISDLECFSPFTTFQIRCNIIKPQQSDSDAVDSLQSKDSTNSDTDEVDYASEESRIRTIAANNRWKHIYGDEPLNGYNQRVKIHFPNDQRLAVVHTLAPEEIDDYAAARKGPWEQFARDRERFKNRISEVEKVITPCLQPEHRENISAKLQHHSSQ